MSGASADPPTPGHRRSPWAGTRRGPPAGARRWALVGALVLAACSPDGGSGDPGDGADPLRPRPGAPVVLISLDTLRADHLGCLGDPRGLTPNLDAFAAEALLFERCWSSANNTAPSHMTMMSGLSPLVHGIDHGEPGRPAEAVPLLADVLAEAGWDTWALADGGFVTRGFGFDRGFDRFQSELQPFEHKLPTLLEWIAEGPRAGQAGDAAPRLLFLHTYEPHSPYAPREEYDRFTDDAYDGRLRPMMEEIRAAFENPDQSYEMGVLARNFWKDRGYLQDDDVEYLRGLYAGDVLQTDALMGRVLQALRVTGWFDEAWIVITSDHGEAFREHGSFEHRQLFTEELRVPLLIRPPGGLPGGRRTAATARLLDLTPTILHAVGLPQPPLVEGHSLLPLDPQRERPIYAVAGESKHYRSLQLGDLKLHRRLGGRIELYDLSRDPGETDDLNARDPPPPWADSALAAMGEIEEQAAALREAVGEPGSSGAIDPDVLEELIRLGYIGGDG